MQSQEDQPKTHHSRQISRDLNLPRTTVRRIIHNDLGLKCFKRRRAQELTIANRQARLVQRRQCWTEALLCIGSQWFSSLTTNHLQCMATIVHCLAQWFRQTVCCVPDELSASRLHPAHNSPITCPLMCHLIHQSKPCQLSHLVHHGTTGLYQTRLQITDKRRIAVHNEQHLIDNQMTTCVHDSKPFWTQTLTSVFS